MAKDLKPYAPIVIRYGISLVFIWFGLNQIFNTSSFLGYLPSWANFLPPKTLIILHGIFEALMGLLLLLGLFTRTIAILLSLNLLNTIINLGYNEIMIRDIGLLAALISIILYGKDKLSIHASKEQT
jgi:uncharacterized membrane protein YphA (DoxX/SURF4 family)